MPVRRTFGSDSGFWPTPHGMAVENPCQAGPSGNELGWAVNLWPTPTVTSGAQVADDPTPGQTGGTTLEGAVKVTEGLWRGGPATPPTKGLSLSPDWVCWLMGWPVGWVNLKPLPMSSFLAWLRAFRIESTKCAPSETDRLQLASRSHGMSSPSERD